MGLNRSARKRVKFTPPKVEDAPSSAQVDIYLATYSEGLSEYEARKASGVSRQALAKLKADPAFLARVEDIKADLLDRVEDAAFRQAIVKGDKDLIKLILQARRQQDYGTKTPIALSIDVTKMSTEELDEFIAKHGKR